MSRASQVVAEDKPSVIKASLVVFTAALFFFFNFIQMSCFNALGPAIGRAFSLSAGALGGLSGSYFWGTVCFLLPAGFLLDRYSARKLLLAAFTLSLVFTVLLSVSVSWSMALLARFITGVGNAFCFISILRLASAWFSSRHLAFVMGSVVTIGLLGGIAAQSPLSVLVAQLGWREALLFDASLGLLFLSLMGLFVQDSPLGMLRERHDTLTQNSLPLGGALQQVLRQPVSLLLGPVACCLNLPLMVLGGTWGEIYLTQVYSLTLPQASWVITQLYLGMMVGAPLIGYWSDWKGSRKEPLFFGTLVTLCLVSGLWWARSLSLSCLLVLFFGIGFFSSAQVLVYTLVEEKSDALICSTALGVTSMWVMGGPALFDFCYGWVLQSGRAAPMALYTAGDFRRAMVLFPVALLLGLSILSLTDCCGKRRGE